MNYIFSRNVMQNKQINKWNSKEYVVPASSVMICSCYMDMNMFYSYNMECIQRYKLFTKLICGSTLPHKSEYWHTCRTAREHNIDTNYDVLSAQTTQSKTKYDIINVNPNIYVIYTSINVMHLMW
jgi:hypothetical protein